MPYFTTDMSALQQTIDICQWLDQVAPPQSQLRIVPVSEETTQHILATLAILPHDTTIRIMLISRPLAVCPACWEPFRQDHSAIPVFPGGWLTTHLCSEHTYQHREVV